MTPRIHDLILAITLAVCCLGGQVVEKMDAPESIFIQEAVRDHYTYFKSQNIEVEFVRDFSAFSGTVYERKSPFTGTNVSQDYLQNPDEYKMSSMCYFVAPTLDLNTEGEILNTKDYKLVDHVVDWESKCVYLLTQDMNVLKSCGNDNKAALFNADQQIQVLGQINSTNSTGELYFFQDRKLLYVRSKTQLFVYNGSMLEPVQGFQEDEFSRNFIILGNRLFVLSPYKFVSIYRFDDYKTLRRTAAVRSWSETTFEPVDFKVINNSLWVLDSKTGLFSFNLNDDKVQQKDEYPLRYGKKLFFEVYQNTFEVVFELNEDTYVAELIMITEGTLNLNRFYNHIDDIKKVFFLKERLAIVGEEEIMVIQHSINNHLLSDIWEDRQLYSTEGLVEQKARGNYLHDTGVFFTVLTDNGVNVITYDRQFAKIICEYSSMPNVESGYTIYAEINSTDCSRTGNYSKFCTNRFSFSFSLEDVVSETYALILTVVTVVVSAAIITLLWLLMIRARLQKKKEIQLITKELNDKIEKKKKEQQSGSDV